MVDNSVPTNQFHEYQRPDATPHSESMRGGLGSMLNRFGMDPRVGQMRDYARNNPSKVLGGLAALVIGAGLLRGRR
jgi:hypothetical protein